MADISVTLTFGYEGTDFTRKYKFDNVQAGALSSIKANVMQFNDEVAEDTEELIKGFFISDDFNTEGEQIVGQLKGIIAAQYETVEYRRINLN